MTKGTSVDQIKELRSRTGVSMMQCKEALEASGGDMDKAIKELAKKGAEVSAKKADRDLGSGTVASYIHAGGNIGAMCELLCETDFVSKNEDFKNIAYEIAMQIAATDDSVLEGGVEELMKQPYIKDTSKTIEDLIQEAVQKFGERTEIGKFTKFSI